MELENMEKILRTLTPRVNELMDIYGALEVNTSIFLMTASLLAEEVDRDQLIILIDEAMGVKQ